MSLCRTSSSCRLWPSALVLAVTLAVLLAPAPATTAPGVDESPPPILQWFESSYQTIEQRMADVFMAGYGFVWLPPPVPRRPGQRSASATTCTTGSISDGPGQPTLYGTEEGLKSLAGCCTAPGSSLHVDFIINHNGFSNLGTPGFKDAGGYPGFVLTLPDDVDGDFHSAFAGGDRARAARRADRHRAREEPPLHPQSRVSPANASNLPRRYDAGVRPPRQRARSAESPLLSRHRPQDDFRVRSDDGTSRTSPCTAFNLDNPMAGDPTVENATAIPDAQRAVARAGDRR